MIFGLDHFSVEYARLVPNLTETCDRFSYFFIQSVILRSGCNVHEIELADGGQIDKLRALLANQDVNIVTYHIDKFFSCQITAVSVIVWESEPFLVNENAFMQIIRIQAFELLDLIVDSTKALNDFEILEKLKVVWVDLQSERWGLFGESLVFDHQEH